MDKRMKWRKEYEYSNIYVISYVLANIIWGKYIKRMSEFSKAR